MKEVKGRTLADLHAIHDKTVVIPNRIRAAVQALADSGDTWTYEMDFLKLARPPVSNTDISRFREQFKDFWAEMPATNGKSTIRRVWFATKQAADEWKENMGG